MDEILLQILQQSGVQIQDKPSDDILKLTQRHRKSEQEWKHGSILAHFLIERDGKTYQAVEYEDGMIYEYNNDGTSWWMSGSDKGEA